MDPLEGLSGAQARVSDPRQGGSMASFLLSPGPVFRKALSLGTDISVWMGLGSDATGLVNRCVVSPCVSVGSILLAGSALFRTWKFMREQILSSLVTP